MLVEDAANPRSRQTERRQERETMQHFTQVIDGIDSSQAELVGYVIDNSPEMDPDRRRPAIPDHSRRRVRYRIRPRIRTGRAAIPRGRISGVRTEILLRAKPVPGGVAGDGRGDVDDSRACRRMACGCRARGGHRVFGRWSSRREPDDGFQRCRAARRRI